MTELRQSEINIEQLKVSIREAVARREDEGRTAFIKASAELFDLLSAQLSEPATLSLADASIAGTSVIGPATTETTPLNLQPEFVPRSDNHYQLEDLLKYHDLQFLWNAYRAVLKRRPDEPGLKAYLEKLRSGRFNKIDVLASMRFSPEGRRYNVTVDGLRTRATIRRMYRLPVIGYLIELTVAIARLPSSLRNQRAVETHLIAQQDRIVQYFNDTNSGLGNHVNALVDDLGRMNSNLTRLSESLSASFADLAGEQKRIARLHHQQLSALFLEQQQAAISRTSLNGKWDSSRASNSLNAGIRSSASQTKELDEIYANFQDQLRGDSETVKEGLRIYLPLIQEAGIHDGILDLGCGRGEWVELLRDQGLQARGLESNSVLVVRARTKKLDVIEAEALDYLRKQPENSLGAVTAFHFVEHVELDQLVELLVEIRRTLRPGGPLIIETPNPKNLVVGACNFYSDPTHRQPLFPESLEFLIRELGFANARLEYLHPVERSPFIGTDEAARALNSWFFSPRDYAVIAYKENSSTTSR